MDLDNVSRTFLSVYRYLNALTSSIDRVVKLKGINSSSFNDYYSNDTFEQTQQIIALTNRKITLINIKVLVDQTLAKLDQQKARVLILKYIDSFSSKQICELLGLNTARTYFRWVKSALKDFVNELKKYVDNNPKVFDKIIKDKWVSSLVSSCCVNGSFESFDGGLIYKTLVKLESSVAV